MPPDNTEHRKLAAIMFTDMVGYSALTQRDEALALELLREHHEILRAILPRHQGNEIKSTGDGLLVEFPSALAAVQAAVEIQQFLASRNANALPRRAISIRIGIHLGDVVWRDDDVLGDGVNIAARVQSLAEPGGICVSRAVYDQIENKVSQSVVKLKHPELKNIAAKVDVFKLVLDPSAVSGAAHPGRIGRKAALSLAGALVVIAAVGALIWRHAGPGREAPARPAASTTPPASTNAARGDQKITQILDRLRQKYDLPGMALAVVTSDGIKWAGVSGVRKRGADIPVGLDDQWYLGSESRIMTSVLIAQLVDRGKLRWDSTLGEVFPELTSEMNPEYQKVTILELLSHHAGMANTFALSNYPGQNVEALRLRVVRRELSNPPASPPGKEFGYCNLDYIVAGAVVERITGKSWERAVTDEIFAPLKMKSAGFGGTGTPGQIDQPWGHTEDGQPVARNGPNADFPPVWGPAGRVHCSMQDWAAFVRDQLRGTRGQGSLLRPDSYERLRTPPFGGDYALGWRLLQSPWADGAVLYHGASSIGSFASVRVAPGRNLAIVFFINQTGSDLYKVSNEATAEIVRLLRAEGQLK